MTLVLNYIEWEWSGDLDLYYNRLLVTLQWIIHFQWIYMICNPLGVGVCGTIYLRKFPFTWSFNNVIYLGRPRGQGGQVLGSRSMLYVGYSGYPFPIISFK